MLFAHPQLKSMSRDCRRTRGPARTNQLAGAASQQRGRGARRKIHLPVSELLGSGARGASCPGVGRVQRFSL